jgi:opacity protein-like surface antigen
MARFLIAVFAIFAVVLVDSAPTIAGEIAVAGIGLEPPPPLKPKPPVKRNPKPTTPNAVVASSVPDWAGPYIEGRLGYAFDAQGSAIGNLGVGANLQFGSVVLGAELSVDRLNYNSPFQCAPGVQCNFDSRWMPTVQGLLGYAVDRFLPYVTVGAAVADFTSVTPIGYESTSKVGVLLGGGFKIDLGNRLSSNVEYRWIDFGPIPWAITPRNSTVSELLFGLSYRLTLDGLGDRSR